MSAIFLSYSSPQSEAATRIELALEADGHSVFRDRTDLPPGEPFDGRIRDAVKESDLFIFLISQQSIAEGRYTLTELKFAEEKWGHPAGHVLPVLIEPLPKEAIPEFLRAVTMLQPRGDLAAEVAAAVERMTAPRWHWFLKPQGMALAAVVALLLAIGVWQGLSWHHARREQIQQVTKLLKQGQLQSGSGNYSSAWNLLEQAGAMSPASDKVIEAQERLAMAWLENARGNELTGSLKDIADKVSPVLSRGAAAGKGQRSADLLAHLGWADFLRVRLGVGGLDPVRHYRRAIEIEPANVFAHTMWGFEILRKGGSFADAKAHFTVALESKREREYVRHMQLAALQWSRKAELEIEAIRVASEMRSGGETMRADTPEGSDAWRLWDIYYSRIVTHYDKPQFLAALPPADHLATFRWLYPEDQLPKGKKHLYLYILAQLQEFNGDRSNALASYRQLRSELGNEQGRLVDDSDAAIRRLTQ
jgi:TIR domain